MDGRGVRVVRVERGSALVIDEGGPVRVRCAAPVAVGDWVRVSEGDDPHVVGVEDRRGVLSRLDPSGLLQVLAANVDLVLVAAPADRLSAARVEREVAMGWESGAQPVVMLTKADLDDGTLLAELEGRLVGVRVIPVSATNGEGLDAVRDLLSSGATAVMIGPSGAGKSTLVNALLGWDVTATGAVRDSDHRGRHSTTFRELHEVPTGGFLIDTPGLRSLSLAVDDQAVAATFPEVAKLAENCRFRDCRHEHEPGCAVNEAVSSGLLPAARLESYHKIARELDYHLRRDDPAAASQARAVLKARSKASRRFFKERGSR